MAASGATMVSPTEKLYAGIIGDLMHRFDEMCDPPKRPCPKCGYWSNERSSYVPSADRLLVWTECAGRDSRWREANAADLRWRAKAGLPITKLEFDTWKYSMQTQLMREGQPGESLSDWYDRLRRLHGIEFPTYQDEPYYRHRFDMVKEMVYAGRGTMVLGLSGSGKTAAGALLFESLAALKDEQIAYGSRSTLALMVGKKIGKGGRPDSPPDPNPDHLGLWYARNICGISNFSLFNDPRTGVVSPVAGRWHRRGLVSGVFLKLADVEEAGDYAIVEVDEGGLTADKFTQGSERVKTIIGMTRIVRGYNAAMVWMSQYGVDDFPKELAKSAETRWLLPPPKGDKAQGKATVTVPGTSLHERVISDIPLPVSGFDTKEKPILQADISVKVLLESISAKREKWERTEKKIWGREQRAQSLREAVTEQLEHIRRNPKAPISTGGYPFGGRPEVSP